MNIGCLSHQSCIPNGRTQRVCGWTVHCEPLRVEPYQISRGLRRAGKIKLSRVWREFGFIAKSQSLLSGEGAFLIWAKINLRGTWMEGGNICLVTLGLGMLELGSGLEGSMGNWEELPCCFSSNNFAEQIRNCAGVQKSVQPWLPAKYSRK